MKIYLVWYRIEGEKEDRIRGAARSWETAEKMAENMEFYLNVQGLKNFEFGVKSYEHGLMSFDLINNDGSLSSWGKEEFGE